MRKKRAPWPRRGKAIRNLLLVLLLGAVIWGQLGKPLPTREMELHRAERECLIDPSVVVFTCESEPERELGDPVMLVGVSGDTVQTSSRTHRFNIWPKNPEGATLVVLPSELEYSPSFVAGLVAVEPPAPAETARLTIGVSEGAGPLRTVSGEKSGSVFLFRLEEAEGQPLDCLFHTTKLPPYTLEFFSADGALLETVTNTGNVSRPASHDENKGTLQAAAG